MANPSLLMIPSGFKSTKLYSVLPSDGTGDFTHARSTTATRVNSSNVVETSAIDVPRLDYTDGTCPVLLLEPQSTNLILRSEEIDVGPWLNDGTVTVTANNVVSPDGLLTAEKFNVATGAGGRKQTATYGSAIGNVTFSFSVWARTDVPHDFSLRIHDPANTGDVTETIFNLTTQWQRFTITHTFLAPSVSTTVFTLIRTAELGNTSNRNTFVWGAQLEQLPYSTSYIPTASGTVTRTADSTNNAGVAATFNSPEGVLYGSIAALSDTLNNRYISVSDGTVANRVLIGYNTTTEQITAIIDVGSVNQATLTYTSADITAFSKVAVKWKANDFALWVDGVERDTDVVGSSFGASVLNELSFDDGAGANDFYGKTKDLRVYKTALTDGELQTLTT